MVYVPCWEAVTATGTVAGELLVHCGSMASAMNKCVFYSSEGVCTKNKVFVYHHCVTR